MSEISLHLLRLKCLLGWQGVWCVRGFEGGRNEWEENFVVKYASVSFACSRHFSSKWIHLHDSIQFVFHHIISLNTIFFIIVIRFFHSTTNPSLVDSYEYTRQRLNESRISNGIENIIQTSQQPLKNRCRKENWRNDEFITAGGHSGRGV